MSEGIVVLALSLALGCGTTKLYPGPRRSEREVATIETQKLAVVSVDERAVTASRAAFEVLAGVHTLLIRRDNLTRALCLTARGGHAYLIRPVRGEGLWYPEVIDENTTSVIAAKTTSPVAPDCSSEP